MEIARLGPVVTRSWWPDAPVWRLAVAVFLVMQGAAGVGLAQGSENYIVRFRNGTSAAAGAAVVRQAGAALGATFGRVNAAAVRVPNTMP